MNRDLIKYGWNNLVQRKRRSFLTILSIFIGIMAIFALVSFGQGLSHYVDSIADEMGADKLTILPKGSFNPADSLFTYSEKDLDFVRKISGVETATGYIMNSVQVQDDLDNKAKYTYALSMPPGTDEMKLTRELFTIDIEVGRELKKGDTDKVTVGYDYGQDNKIFSRGLTTGSKFYVNGQRVEIAGIYESIGNPSDDRNIYFSEEGMIGVLGKELSYNQIAIRSAQGVEPSELADKIQEKFRKYKGQAEGKEDFTVSTFEELIESFSSILGVVNGVLVLISLISVFVAAVNIMNTMYTAVLERTNEIGVMKAIGAQNKDILFVFVFEAGLLGLIGSLTGMLLGYLIAEAGGAFAASAGFASLQPIYPLWLIGGVIFFGIAIGVISGLAPAIQASKQKPVESLRYE